MWKSMVLAGLLLAGCGSPPDPALARAGDIELSTRAMDRALGAGTLFLGMGQIAPNMPADINAAAIYQRIMNETNGCAMTVRTGASLDVDLGAGCTLASTNVVYAGTMHADVTKPATSQIVISVMLNITVDNGQPLTGTLNITTTDGTSFTFGAGLTFNGVIISTPMLAVGIADYGAAWDATGTIKGTSGMFTLTATGVHQRFAGCYPDDGYLEISAPAVGMTLAIDEFWLFSSSTPQDGNAQVGVSAADTAARNVPLPGRMGCPAGANAENM
jgi:hypothetical protein